MKLHKEGTASIILALTFVAVSSILIWKFIPFMWMNIVLQVGLIVLLSLILLFFRVPKRTIHFAEDGILAPADGKIVVIERTIESEYFKDERIQVSIFMSPLNVHRNTYPCEGKVTYTQYHKGKYLVAWHPKSSTLNERSTVVLKRNDGTEILIRQIAGAVARRICTYSSVDDQVKQGDELGFIKFGSRVDVFLPLNTEIACAIDQKSVHNQTLIAKI